MRKELLAKAKELVAMLEECAEGLESCTDKVELSSLKPGETFMIKQNELRDDAKIEISVKTKLAGVISAKTNFAMGKDLKTGEVLINEYGKQIPGQLSFAEVVEPEAEGKKNITIMPRALKA